MNSANETLRGIRTRKAILKKEHDESIELIKTKYQQDIAILDKEEQELLKQFNDVPINDIYKTDTQPKKYRKKPVIIEAYQTDKELEIETLEGTMKANPGDYIVTGVQGETYPVKPDIFHETYEEVK